MLACLSLDPIDSSSYLHSYYLSLNLMIELIALIPFMGTYVRIMNDL